jgi:hypothetical protein
MDIWLVKLTVDVVQTENIGRKVCIVENFANRILPHLINAGNYYVYVQAMRTCDYACYDHLQVKWRFLQHSHKFIATDMGRVLHYFIYIYIYMYMEGINFVVVQIHQICSL